MNFSIQTVLENEKYQLIPLQQGDFESLYEVASDPKVWDQHPNKDRYKREVFENFFKGAIESKGAFKIIEKETLVIKAKKGKDDRLFGTITNSEISKELKKKYNVDIDRKKIIVENPIKIVGEYIITIKLEQGVIADLKVDIVGE